MRSIRALMALVGAIGLLSAPAASAQSHRHPALIALEAARSIALERVPGTVQSEEYEFEGHEWIYSFEIVPTVQDRPGIEEVNVDADTGVILSVEHERG
jgi:uncharacterized membrane protein YkoI